MDMDVLYFKSEFTWINLFVGGEIYPVQLKTLLNPETSGTYFRERIVKNSEGIRASVLQWETSPNHIKYRMDIDRDGLLFRQVLQYMRYGSKTSVPDDQFTLQALANEAEFYGMERYRRLLNKKLWKMTGKASFYACYSDSE